MTTPNLEGFSAPAFAKEIQTFMKANGISVREWAELAETSPSNLRRLKYDKGNTTIELVAKIQKAMRTYTPSKKKKGIDAFANAASRPKSNSGSRPSRRAKK